MNAHLPITLHCTAGNPNDVPICGSINSTFNSSINLFSKELSKIIINSYCNCSYASAFVICGDDGWRQLHMNDLYEVTPTRDVRARPLGSTLSNNFRRKNPWGMEPRRLLHYSREHRHRYTPSMFIKGAQHPHAYRTSASARHNPFKQRKSQLSLAAVAVLSSGLHRGTGAVKCHPCA